MSEPNRDDWLVLYKEAILFQQVSPWEWMGNEDFFAVENPDNREVGYCSILGCGGTEFGLGIFLGDDGYHTYIRLMSRELDPENMDDIEESIMLRGISMLFVDRDVLQKKTVR